MIYTISHSPYTISELSIGGYHFSTGLDSIDQAQVQTGDKIVSLELVASTSSGYKIVSFQLIKQRQIVFFRLTKQRSWDKIVSFELSASTSSLELAASTSSLDKIVSRRQSVTSASVGCTPRTLFLCHTLLWLRKSVTAERCYAKYNKYSCIRTAAQCVL